MTDNHDIENFEDETIVFADDEGNEIEFTEIAYFEHNGKNYSALAPVLDEPLEEDEEQEVVFCEVTDDEDGFEVFEVVDSDELIDELFEVFLKLEEAGCGCGCGCDGEEE